MMINNTKEEENERKQGKKGKKMMNKLQLRFNIYNKHSNVRHMTAQSEPACAK